MTSAMVEVAGLMKRFGRAGVLRGVDVTIARGRITGIVGPNGAGKSTLIKLILGLMRPTSGQILVDGRPVDEDGLYRAHIGYMPQMGRFPEHLTARELFETMHEVRGRGVRVNDDLVSVLSLEDHLDKPLRTLSGGTRQKVNACLALRFSPALLILDEPTAGLDPRTSALLKDNVLCLRPSGVTTIVASHVMSELEELCDDIVFLLDGRVRYTGPISELRGLTRQANLERAVAALMIREVA